MTTEPKPIPLSRVEIDDEIRSRVMSAVESGQYILGPECKAFEKELAAYFGREHCVLVANATAGLMLTMLAHGVDRGDEVLVPSHTAFPTIEAVFQAGATPVFIDIDERYTMDPAWLEPRITHRTKAILPVHIYGHPCDLDAIDAVAKRHGLPVIEDCAQAHGAEWKGRKVGSFGSAAVLSFYPSKNLPVLGDGGAVVTDDAGIAAKLRMLRDHGRQSKHTHDIVGWNLRFNEIQAAAGRVMLRRLDAMNEHRRKIAGIYGARLKDAPIVLPTESKLAKHVFHLYVIRTPQRDALAKHLAADKIQTGVHYPLATHQQPGTLGRSGVRNEGLPRTEAICKEILSLPVFPSLAEADAERVAASVLRFFEKA